MKLKICFDVDGTLIHQTGRGEDTPRYDVISLFHAFQKLGHELFIWSGGGITYAERWRDKLGLDAAKVAAKGSFQADIAVDDFPSDDLNNESIKSTLGKVLMKV